MNAYIECLLADPAAPEHFAGEIPCYHQQKRPAFENRESWGSLIWNSVQESEIKSWASSPQAKKGARGVGHPPIMELFISVAACGEM
jgi:hypothetical protein